MSDLTQTRRVPELDALRGIAALSVLLFHFTFGYDNGFDRISPNHFYFRYGYLGVSLFFVISGFVIFMTLEKTKDTKSFVVSRFSRLYPAYWTAIIATVFLVTLFNAPIQKNAFSLKQVLLNLTMVQSLFKVKDVDGAYWTLIVELIFYWWMWIVFRTKKLKYIEWIGVAWITVSIFIIALDFSLKRILRVVFIAPYAPLFVAGIFFYRLREKAASLLLHALILISFFAECYLLFASSERFDFIPYVIVAAIYIVFYLFTFNGLSVLNNHVLLFFGGISYSLYLIHENVGYAIIYWTRRIADSQVICISVAAIVVIALATMVNRFIERPAMKAIRDYFYK